VKDIKKLQMYVTVRMARKATF